MFFRWTSLLIAMLSSSSFKDLHMAEISCLLGQKWRSLTPAEKLPYKKGSLSFQERLPYKEAVPSLRSLSGSQYEFGITLCKKFTLSLKSSFTEAARLREEHALQYPRYAFVKFGFKSHFTVFNIQQFVDTVTVFNMIEI